MTKISFIASIFTVIMIGPVSATEWSISSSVNSSVSYDDNIFMAEDEVGSAHYTVTPTVLLQRTQDDNSSSLSFGYIVDRYASLPDLDKQNPFLRFNSTFQSERSQWTLSADYAESSSRDTAEADAGDFTTESTVATKSISPSYRYQLTERDSLSLSGSYSEKEYSTVDFSDNETLSLAGNWQHQFSERFNGGLSISASNNQSDGEGLRASVDDDSYNLSTTLNYKLSELWSIGARVGVRHLNSHRTDDSGLDENNRSSGLSFDIDASKKTELDTFSVGLSRTVSPSSTGDVNETDRLNLSWSRQLRETINIGLTASYQSTTSALNDSNDTRDNISLSPSVYWKFARNLGVNLAYNYRQQERSELNTDVSSNALTLSLNYDWDGRRSSR